MGRSTTGMPLTHSFCQHVVGRDARLVFKSAFATRLARYCARNPYALKRLTGDRTAKAEPTAPIAHAVPNGRRTSYTSFRATGAAAHTFSFPRFNA